MHNDKLEISTIQFSKCSCKGYNLDKLIQPMILTILAEEDLYGYKILQEIIKTTMFKESEKPDPTGVYRFLKNMEKRGLVVSSWDVESAGPAKRFYKLTQAGKECLAHWIETLEEYQKNIGDLVKNAQKVLEKSNF